MRVVAEGAESTTSIDEPTVAALAAEVKAANKRRLAGWIERHHGIVVDPAGLFDVQVKRMHEYKRQLLNVLHIVARYQAILDRKSVV